jgi:hypothetical protein
MAFQHIPSTIGALEAEEVGVEHLLRLKHYFILKRFKSHLNFNHYKALFSQVKYLTIFIIIFH